MIDEIENLQSDLLKKLLEYHHLYLDCIPKEDGVKVYVTLAVLFKENSEMMMSLTSPKAKKPEKLIPLVEEALIKLEKWLINYTFKLTTHQH